MLGVEVQSQDWQEIVAKLKEQMQNYDEDKRSLKQMIAEREHYAAEAERLRWQYSQLTEEKSVLESKLDNNLAVKLEKKVKLLEEERSEMKSDFQIKIYSFVEEISQLKDKLSSNNFINK